MPDSVSTPDSTARVIGSAASEPVVMVAVAESVSSELEPGAPKVAFSPADDIVCSDSPPADDDVCSDSPPAELVALASLDPVLAKGRLAEEVVTSRSVPFVAALAVAVCPGVSVTVVYAVKTLVSVAVSKTNLLKPTVVVCHRSVQAQYMACQHRKLTAGGTVKELRTVPVGSTFLHEQAFASPSSAWRRCQFLGVGVGSLVPLSMTDEMMSSATAAAFAALLTMELDTVVVAVSVTVSVVIVLTVVVVTVVESALVVTVLTCNQLSISRLHLCRYSHGGCHLDHGSSWT